MSSLCKKLLKKLWRDCTSAGDDEAYLTYLKKCHAGEKADLEKWLTASEGGLVDADRRFQDFKHNKNTVDDLVTMVDEA